MLIHPTLDQLRALKLDGMAQAFARTRSARGEPQSRATPNGWRCCSTAKRPAADTKRFQARLRVARLRHSQAASRTSTSERRAARHGAVPASWRPATGSTRTTTCSSPAQPGWRHDPLSPYFIDIPGVPCRGSCDTARPLLIARFTAGRSRSVSRITYGAPMQVCLAGSTPSLMRRTTVILLMPKRLAASCRITSPRSARSPSR